MPDPIKLTPAQRRALETIAAGGCTHHRSRWGSQKDWVTVPDGAAKISLAVYERLSRAGLLYGYEPITLSSYGRDVLAGTVRPPIAASVGILLDGQTIATVPIELDPYAWQLDNPDERGPWLEREAASVLRNRVTATIHIGPELDETANG